MSKELWIDAKEYFIEKYGREPTDKEMDEWFSQYASELIDICCNQKLQRLDSNQQPED